MEEIPHPPDVPHIEKYYSHDWIPVLLTRRRWIRQIAPYKDIDSSKQILGETLSYFTGNDDMSLPFEAEDLIQLNARVLAKKSMRTLLHVGLKTPKFPKRIKGHIRDAAKDVFSENWETDDGLLEARTRWQAFKNHLREEIAKDKNLTEAVMYAKRNEEILYPYWKAYIYDL